jgi:hypothetical protein
MRKLPLRTAFFALILLVLTIFPYGPLFPWSPVKPGYDHVALARADVYYPAGTQLDPAYRRLDEYIAASEAYHRLKAPKRICVVACNDWGAFGRFLPQHRGSRGVGAVTLATGTVIYVSPRLAERGLDAGEFLRHEISHATINQNQSLTAAYRFSDAMWLCEGIAVAFGNQKAYYSRTEFLARARREKDLPQFIDPARRTEVQGIFDMRYAYQAWRYFNEFLMARDRAAYQRYLLAVMEDPRKWREQFAPALGIRFEEAIELFQVRISQ